MLFQIVIDNRALQLTVKLTSVNLLSKQIVLLNQFFSKKSQHFSLVTIALIWTFDFSVNFVWNFCPKFLTIVETVRAQL